MRGISGLDHERLMSQGEACKSPWKKACDLCSRKIPLAPELRMDDRAVLLEAKDWWELIAEGQVRADGVLGQGCSSAGRERGSGIQDMFLETR